MAAPALPQDGSSGGARRGVGALIAPGRQRDRRKAPVWLVPCLLLLLHATFGQHWPTAALRRQSSQAVSTVSSTEKGIAQGTIKYWEEFLQKCSNTLGLSALDENLHEAWDSDPVVALLKSTRLTPEERAELRRQQKDYYHDDSMRSVRVTLMCSVPICLFSMLAFEWMLRGAPTSWRRALSVPRLISPHTAMVDPRTGEEGPVPDPNSPVSTPTPPVGPVRRSAFGQRASAFAHAILSKQIRCRLAEIMRVVLSVDEAKVLECAGMDALVLLRYCALCGRFCALCGLWCLVLIPLYSTGGNWWIEGPPQGLSCYSLSNLRQGSWKLWAVVPCSYLCTLTLCGLLWKEYERFVQLRQSHLGCHGPPPLDEDALVNADFPWRRGLTPPRLPLGDSLSDPETTRHDALMLRNSVQTEQARRTVLIERLPPELQDPASLRAVLEDLLGQGTVHSVAVVPRDARKLSHTLRQRARLMRDRSDDGALAAIEEQLRFRREEYGQAMSAARGPPRIHFLPGFGSYSSSSMDHLPELPVCHPSLPSDAPPMPGEPGPEMNRANSRGESSGPAPPAGHGHSLLSELRSAAMGAWDLGHKEEGRDEPEDRWPQVRLMEEERAVTIENLLMASEPRVAAGVSWERAVTIENLLMAREPRVAAGVSWVSSTSSEPRMIVQQPAPIHAKYSSLAECCVAATLSLRTARSAFARSFGSLNSVASEVVGFSVRRVRQLVPESALGTPVPTSGIGTPFGGLAERTPSFRLPSATQGPAPLSVAGPPAASTTAFVTFRTLQAACIACQVVMDEDAVRGSELLAQPAPEPRDIVWRNVARPESQQLVRQFFVELLLLLAVIFWAVPVSLLQAWCSMARLQKLLPWLNISEKYASTDAYALLTLYLPVMALLALLEVLPVLLQRLARHYEGIKSRSAVQMLTMKRYWRFQLATMGVTVLSGTFSDALRTIKDHPASILWQLGQSVPKVWVFFLVTVLSSALVVGPVSLLRLPVLVRVSFGAAKRTIRRRLSRCSPSWQQETREVSPKDFLDSPDLAVDCASALFVLMVCATYATIAPLIMLAGLLFFVLRWHVLAVRYLYVHVPHFDSGGAFWYLLWDQSIFALVFGNATTFAVVGLRAGYAQLPFLLPLIVLPIGFKMRAEYRFAEPSQRLSLRMAKKLDSLDDRVAERFAPDAYWHPALRIAELDRAHYRGDWFNGAPLGVVSEVWPTWVTPPSQSRLRNASMSF